MENLAHASNLDGLFVGIAHSPRNISALQALDKHHQAANSAYAAAISIPRTASSPRPK
jgi:hypothetical protein